jgi:outer membrane protein OmpA-like peptidoglycan-associated protein
MTTPRFMAALLLFASCNLLTDCKSTEHSRGNGGGLKILGYTDEDAPVGTVLVTTMGGGAPAVILAQQLDVQTEASDTTTSKKNIALESNERITFDSLLVFERNTYQITPAMEENLSRIVRMMKKYENTTIFIEGYSDMSDAPRHNLNLSEKRAKAVADYLAHRNIKSSRIQTRGYGDTQPLFSNKLAQGRIKNRRVEVSIIARANNEQKRSKK